MVGGLAPPAGLDFSEKLGKRGQRGRLPEDRLHRSAGLNLHAAGHVGVDSSAPWQNLYFQSGAQIALIYRGNPKALCLY